MKGEELINQYTQLTPEITYTLLALGIIVGLLVIYGLVISFKLRKYADKVLLSLEEQEAKRNQATWMDLFIRRNAKGDEVVAGHEYDGIQEFDNPPPAWFNWLFYGTIAFAAIYLLRYHVFNAGMLQEAEYNAQMKSYEGIIAKAQENAIKFADMPMYTVKAKIESGKKIYTANCVMCHGKSGEGSVGPNLTDEYWLHGGSYKQIFTTIFNGVPEKGMLAWKKTLKPEELREVSSYIVTLIGTNPPNPKAPQGKKDSETSNQPVAEPKQSSQL